MPLPLHPDEPRTAAQVQPRWLVRGLGILFLVFLAYRILHDPVWTVQRLASPDGRRIALLQRTTYIQDHFRVRVKDGHLWFVPYYSPPFTNDDRVDLGERLHWSEDSNQLFFRLRGKDVWVYDFPSDKGHNLADPKLSH